MFDFVGKKRWFLLASAIIILAGIISLSIPGGLKLGIDFQEGTAVTLGSMEGDTLTLEEVEDRLGQGDLAFLGNDVRIQVLSEGDFYIRTRELVIEQEQETLKSALGEIGVVEVFGNVSAAIASKTVNSAIIAVSVAAIVILLYITWVFRKMPNPFRYGTCAIIALIHDVLVVLGIFSILGRILNWEVDPMFVTACLAVIGYSVNDTIVVFDRLRENLPKGITPDLDTNMNISLNQTLTRSLNTSITTLLAVLAVYLFVGGSIQTFAMALFVGIASGTYSSIFIASQLLVVWERGNWTRYIPRIPFIPRILRRV